MSLNEAETSVARSQPSVPYGANYLQCVHKNVTNLAL